MSLREVEFTYLLDRLRTARLSVNLLVDTLDVVLYPSTDDEQLVSDVRDFFDAVKELLPGFCDNCSAWTIKRVVSFWGAAPHYCSVCLNVALKFFKENDRWPAIEVPDTIEQI